MLLATLIGEAGLVMRAEQQAHPSYEAPLLDRAVEELRGMTKGFTDPAFLKATRAARRRNPPFSPAAPDGAIANQDKRNQGVLCPTVFAPSCSPFQR